MDAAPGGWADPGDSPAQAVEREIREESGYLAHTVKLAACYDRDRRHFPPFYFSIYKLFFICELTGGAPAPSLETSEIAFFAEDQIPAELSTGRVTLEEIAMLFAHHKNSELPTEFD